MDKFTPLLAKEFSRREEHIENILRLLDEGNTIPFIARYRKELHGSMDDTALRTLEERLAYLRNLTERKESVKASIAEQEKLTDELAAAIDAAQTLAEVEDLYRPYKPKRRTRATVAKEKGLEPLAALLFALRYHLSKRGKHLSDLFKPAPPAPPHVEAIRALEGLHNQKLWQNNKHKAYYSGLTDILRRYLAGRYGIGALEMTSDEIIDAVRPLDLPRKSAMELTALLREADLVKFAKATPEAARNEEAYQWAYYFVEETKPVEEQPSAEAEEPLDLTPKNDSHA